MEIFMKKSIQFFTEAATEDVPKKELWQQTFLQAFFKEFKCNFQLVSFYEHLQYFPEQVSMAATIFR